MGVVIYEILTLEAPFPFDGKNIPMLIKKIKFDDFKPLPKNILPELSELVSELLQKDPNDRPSLFEIAQRPFLKTFIKDILSKNYEDYNAVEAFFNMVYLKNLNSPGPSKSNFSSPNLNKPSNSL